MSILSREWALDLEIRSDGTGRTLHGILVPYGQVATVSDGGPPYQEGFRFGAFARDIAARAGNFAGVKLLMHHDRTDPVGRATDVREDPAGLYVAFQVSRTTRGDEALTLYEDGVLDRFSVGFRPLAAERDAGVVWRTKAALREGSLVTFPAYAGATVNGLRDDETSPDEGDLAVLTADERSDLPPTTPDPDPAAATPLGGLTPAQRRERILNLKGSPR